MDDPFPFSPFCRDCCKVAIKDSLRTEPLVASAIPLAPQGFLGFRRSESVRDGGRGGFLDLRSEMARDSDRSLYKLVRSSV